MSESSLREQVAAIVAGLPEATCKGDRHLTFAVRKKTFGYFLDDHHGDGRVGVAFKAEIRELLTDAYRLLAPRTLVAQLDG